MGLVSKYFTPTQHIVSHRLATIYIVDMENHGRIVAIDVGAKHLRECVCK
jgi:hypothetical protein